MMDDKSMNSEEKAVIFSPFFNPDNVGSSLEIISNLSGEGDGSQEYLEASTDGGNSQNTLFCPISVNENETSPASFHKYHRRPGKRYSTVKKKSGRKKAVTSHYFENADDKLTETFKLACKNEYLSTTRKINKWIPPRSPYALIQEDLFDSPWQLLVATIFLTKTRAQLAIPQIHRFLAKWPTPESLLKAEFEEIHELLKPLGLGTLRCHSIIRFTKEFLGKEWQYPIELHGIGKYGNDSYRMFCVNEWRQVSPTDIPLSKYKEWLLTNEEKLGLK